MDLNKIKKIEFMDNEEYILRIYFKDGSVSDFKSLD